MQRLIYVSESCIKQPDHGAAVSQIVAGAQTKNAELGLTGALIFTGQLFAQVLEGSPASIHMLMAYIYTDPRHENIQVVETSSITSRQFPEWQMAYHGPSKFVSRHIERLQHTASRPEQRRAAEWLTDLAREFTKTTEPFRLHK